LPLTAALVANQTLLFTRLKGNPVYQVTNYAKAKGSDLLFLIFCHRNPPFLVFGSLYDRKNPVSMTAFGRVNKI
jgi:hypothetical protein